MNFEVSLSRFHFVSALQYLFRVLLQRKPVEANSLLMLEIAFATCFFVVCFCYFVKDKSLLTLNLFISERLDQIPPWNLCFLLETKIKQDPGCPKKEYNAVFKNIQNVRD